MIMMMMMPYRVLFEFIWFCTRLVIIEIILPWPSYQEYFKYIGSVAFFFSFSITDRCPQDTTMEYSYSSTQSFQRLKIRTFRFFNNYDTVYFHCELLACHRNTPNSRSVNQVIILYFFFATFVCVNGTITSIWKVQALRI